MDRFPQLEDIYIRICRFRICILIDAVQILKPGPAVTASDEIDRPVPDSGYQICMQALLKIKSIPILPEPDKQVLNGLFCNPPVDNDFHCIYHQVPVIHIKKIF